MIKVEVSLFPESRGYEVHSFETLAEAEAFCAKNPDAEIVQDHIADAGKMVSPDVEAALGALTEIEKIIFEKVGGSAWNSTFESIRAALTARQAPINRELLEALKYL